MSIIKTAKSFQRLLQPECALCRELSLLVENAANMEARHALLLSHLIEQHTARHASN